MTVWFKVFSNQTLHSSTQMMSQDMMLDVMVGDFPQDLDLTITIKSPTTHSIMIHCSKMDSMSSPRFYTSLVELIVSAICMADFSITVDQNVSKLVGWANSSDFVLIMSITLVVSWIFLLHFYCIFEISSTFLNFLTLCGTRSTSQYNSSKCS